MERVAFVVSSASPVAHRAAALNAAYAQEKEACVEASGVAGGSSVQVNAAPVGAYVVTFGPLEEVGDTSADELLGTCQAARVEAGREAGQSRDPAEGSLRLGSGLVVHWGVLGRTGAYLGPSLLGGWRWELEASAVLLVVEALVVMNSLVGCQGWGRPTPAACCKVQVEWAGPSQSWGCCSCTV